MKPTRNRSRLDTAIKQAARLGVFRSRDWVAAGFPREYLRRLVVRGELRTLGRGLYATADFEGDQHQSLVEAAQRAPRGVVCLFSALQFHGLGTQTPHELWLALPRGAHRPRDPGPPTRFCRFSGPAYDHGIEEHRLPGGVVRAYSPAKTVADCFKYRHKYGLDVALEALREAWREKKVTMKSLAAAAGACRVARVMRPYLEMLA